MKRTELLTVLLAVTFLVMLISACRPRPVSVSIRPSTTPAGTPSTAQPVEFIEAVSTGALEFTLKPVGAFDRVALYPTNKSETTLQVNVEVGTEFAATDLDLQLVVFKRAQLTTQPRQFSMVQLEVASLNINKLPTVNVGTAWKVHKSTRLAKFLECASEALEKKKKSHNSYAKLLNQMDSFMLRDAVWSARGASPEEFLDFRLNRVRMPRSHADVNAAAFDPITREIVQNCGSLKKLD